MVTKIVSNSAKKKPPAAGKGRPKNALNKTTQAAKDAIAHAAEELGGAKRLVAWAKADKANERIFWGKIYPKLLPLQVNGAGANGEHLISNISIKLIKPNAD